jgi:hypothetical protein
VDADLELVQALELLRDLADVEDTRVNERL